MFQSTLRISLENSFLLLVNVKERWYIFPLPYFKLIDRNFNTWWVTYDHSFQRVNYGIKFLHNNFSGRNDKLNIWLITGYTKQVALRYERPFVDRQLRFGYNVYFNYAKQREVNYATSFSTQKFFKADSSFFVRRLTSMGSDFVYRPALRTKHIFRVQYINEMVADTVIKLNPNYFPAGKTEVAFPEVSYSIQYTHADYNFYLRGDF